MDSSGTQLHGVNSMQERRYCFNLELQINVWRYAGVRSGGQCSDEVIVTGIHRWLELRCNLGQFQYNIHPVGFLDAYYRMQHFPPICKNSSQSESS